jgi:chromosome segregation ATPase
VEVIEGSDISGMTADEVKALVREKQALGEQLSFWKEEARSAKDGSADAEAELQRLREDMKAAEQKIESYEEAKRKSALDAEKAEKKLEKLKAKHKQELDKLNAEIEMIKSEHEEAAEPTEEQRQAIAAEYEAQIEELKQAAKSAEEEKKKLENKLKNGSVDEMKAAMRVYFSETQKAINGFIEKLAEIPDPQTRTTYQFGTVRWLKGVIEDLEELEE